VTPLRSILAYDYIRDVLARTREKPLAQGVSERKLVLARNRFFLRFCGSRARYHAGRAKFDRMRTAEYSASFLFAMSRNFSVTSLKSVYLN
jgi:hypothetical protein